MVSRTRAFASGALLMWAVACEGAVAPEPSLTLSPVRIELSLDVPSASVFLATDATSGSWQVTSTPAWATVSPDRGTLGAAVAEIVVMADFEAMPQAVAEGVIDIVSSVGTGRVTVVAVGDTVPKYQLSDSALQVAAEVDTTSFNVINTGRVPLEWWVPQPPGWLSVSPAGGALAEAGDEATVTVTVDKNLLPAGTLDREIRLHTNAQPAELPIPLVIVVPPEPILSLSRTQLKYPIGIDARLVELRNTGKGDATWVVEEAPEWLSVEPPAGVVPQGTAVGLTLTVERSSVPGGQGAAIVRLTADAESAAELAVFVLPDEGLPLGLTPLSHRVVDAEYDAAADRIITISNDPPTLHVIDPERATVESLALPLTANTIGVQPGGALAAVGHDAWVTIVDLRQVSVVVTHAVQGDVGDVVFPNGASVHLFPDYESAFQPIWTVEVTTGNTARGSSVYGGMKAKLHPSGSAAYAATATHPSDVEKFGFGTGSAQFAHDSPYHGDYPVGGDLWITPDGLRIITRGGSVFHASPIDAEDIRYAGSLEGESLLKSVATSTARGRAYAVREAPGDSLYVHDYAFLGELGAVPLPPFSTADVPASSLGRFVFAALDATRVYVLVHAEESSGLTLDWGLVALDADALP